MLSPACESHPLIRFLRDPQTASLFTVGDWERLLRASRRGNLLSRVAYIADRIGLIGQLSEKLQWHLRSALRVAESQARNVNWEIRQVHAALDNVGAPFVVLKGAAYIQCRLEAANGRLLSDIDVMVPRDRLADAEKALFQHGWFPTKLNAYDQRYYRMWMHELPPMQHLDRGTTLDLHHTILPPTASLKPDIDKVWQRAVLLDGEEGIFVLAPIDMILHSAVHLFHDGELEHGLRDLVDIDALLGQFCSREGFWDELADRAIELDLIRPVHYALRFCRAFLQTPIPDHILARTRHAAGLSAMAAAAMDIFVSRSLGAILEIRPGPLTRMCQFSMYVRSHYLRMPMYLLLPHLLRKQFIPEAKRT